MWQSGLDGDGYRYGGTGDVVCKYDDGKYQLSVPVGYTCPTLYNYTTTFISSGTTFEYTYQTSCPTSDEISTYSCTELTGTATSGTPPDNFICFGTTSEETCKANESKYLYRIIGVFDDDSGNKHVKLIKYYSLPSTLSMAYI